MMRTHPVREARAEVVYWIEELQRLLREPTRDANWQAKWGNAHSRWVVANDRYRFVREKMN